MSRAAQFEEQGYLFPVDVFSESEAAGFRSELERLESRARDGRVGNKGQLNYPHVIFRFVDRIVREPTMLDVVEEILGPDLLVWASTFFIKEARTDDYVSWHQDLRYWGLDDEDGQVSAWIALSDVTVEAGCMQFLPGSHKGEMVEHRDTYSEANVLTRGQEAIVEVDESAVVHARLKPGKASLHHGKLLHASAPNRSSDRRIGLAIQYVRPSVQQTVARTDFAMLVRGEDRYGHFEHVPSPREDLSEQARAWHNRILAAQNEAMYEGVSNPAP